MHRGRSGTATTPPRFSAVADRFLSYPALTLHNHAHNARGHSVFNIHFTLAKLHNPSFTATLRRYGGKIEKGADSANIASLSNSSAKIISYPEPTARVTFATVKTPSDVSTCAAIVNSPLSSVLFEFVTSILKLFGSVSTNVHFMIFCASWVQGCAGEGSMICIAEIK